MSSSLLQFAAEYPWSAFMLSLPLTMILVGASWAATVLITNAMNACVSIWAQCLNFVMILVRGYPPESMVINNKGEGGDGEEKPLAS